MKQTEHSSSNFFYNKNNFLYFNTLVVWYMIMSLKENVLEHSLIYIMYMQLGLSTGRSGSGLCPTRNRPDNFGFSMLRPAADW